MTSPETRKEDILRDVSAARQSIIAMIEPLSPAKWHEVFLGEWSLIDLVAHLIGLDQANFQAVQAVRESKLPEFYNHIDRDWRSYNAELVKRYRNDNPQELLSAALSSHTRLVELFESIAPRDLDHDWGVRYKGYRVTIARLLEAEARDEKEHARQISDYFHSKLSGA